MGAGLGVAVGPVGCVSTFARSKKLSVRMKAIRPSAITFGSLSKISVNVMGRMPVPSAFIT
jgi:hypothetical protein